VKIYFKGEHWINTFLAESKHGSMESRSSFQFLE
jgi:hypothetical protein